MVKMTLEVADNGVIKTIVDDNSNGAGEPLEKKRVYVFENDEHHIEKIKFFYELADELNIDTGNTFEDNNLVMTLDWGNSYIPTPDEVELKINLLELEIEQLRKKYLLTHNKESNGE